MKKIFFIFILISNNLFSQTLSDTLNNNENYIFENQIFQESTISIQKIVVTKNPSRSLRREFFLSKQSVIRNKS